VTPVSRLSRLAARGVVAGVLCAAAMLGPASPAQATGTVSVADCSMSGTSQVIETGSPCLLINRWAGGAPFHTRLPWVTSGGTLLNQAQALTAEMWMSVGDALWWAGNWATNFAGDFGIGATVWQAVDNATGQIMQAALKSGVLWAGLGAVLFVVAWRAAHGGGFRYVVKAVLAASALTIMSAAGMSATWADGTPGHMPTTSARGSPGWVATTLVNASGDAVGAVVNPAKRAVQNTAKTLTGTDGLAAADLSDCRRYMETMLDAYDASAGANNPAVREVSALWQNTGYRVHQIVQFGSNLYSDASACWYLEGNASYDYVWGDRSLRQRAAAYLGPTVSPDSFALMPESGDAEDRRMIGWAACRVTADGTITYRPQFVAEWAFDASAQVGPIGNAIQDWSPAGRAKTLTTLCTKFFTESVYQNVPLGANPDDWANTPFDLGGDRVDINKQMVRGSLLDYVMTWHGNQMANMSLPVMLYAVGAFFTAVVLIGLALGVIITKVGLLGLSFVAMFTLVAAMFRINDDGQVARLGKQFVVLSLMSAVSSVILMCVVFMAILMQMVLAQATGGNLAASLIAAALSPVVAAVVVSMLFKKVSGMPVNILNPSAAVSIASMAGSGQIAAAVDRPLSRTGSAAKRMVSRQMDYRMFRRFNRPRDRSASNIQSAVAAGAGAGIGSAAAMHSLNHSIQQLNATLQGSGAGTGPGAPPNAAPPGAQQPQPFTPPNAGPSVNPGAGPGAPPSPPRSGGGPQPPAPAATPAPPRSGGGPQTPGPGPGTPAPPPAGSP